MELTQEDYLSANASQRLIPPKNDLQPKIDDLLSKVVGKTVYQHDPRVLRLIVKWKQNKKADDTTPDNYLEDPAKIAELKKALA